MKKILVIIIVIILLVVAYFVYAKSICMKPYQEIFVISQDSSGVISDAKQCKYVGWKSRYSKSVTQEVAPITQSTINISLPISNQILHLGTTEKIKFTGHNAIDTKRLSISMTEQDDPGIEYYLSGSTKIVYPDPASPILEFTWEVGKYFSHSVDPYSGALSPGMYKLQITDGISWSNSVPVVVK